MDFHISLLPETSRDNSLKTLEEIIQTFDNAYQKKHPNIKRDYFYNPEKDALINGRFWDEHGRYIFLEDLNNGRFWGVLRYIDGSNHETCGDKLENRKIIQNASLQEFANEELQTILDIVVNQALLVPRTGGLPGLTRGHSILYREILEKPDSLFSKAIIPEFKERLYNGRFWEELGEMSAGLNYGRAYPIIKKMLRQKEKLDPAFAKKGFEIFYRNGYIKNPDTSGRVIFDLKPFNGKETDSYWEFAKKVAEQKEIIDADRITLFIPYALQLVEGQFYGADIEEWLPLYRDNAMSIKQRLQEEPLHSYLMSNQRLRLHVAKKIALNLNGYNDTVKPYFKEISRVLNLEKKVQKLMASKAVLYETG